MKYVVITIYDQYESEQKFFDSLKEAEDEYYNKSKNYERYLCKVMQPYKIIKPK